MFSQLLSLHQNVDVGHQQHMNNAVDLLWAEVNLFIAE